MESPDTKVERKAFCQGYLMACAILLKAARMGPVKGDKVRIQLESIVNILRENLKAITEEHFNARKQNME